jgi:hypothetical protein
MCNEAKAREAFDYSAGARMKAEAEVNQAGGTSSVGGAALAGYVVSGLVALDQQIAATTRRLQALQYLRRSLPATFWDSPLALEVFAAFR